MRRANAKRDDPWSGLRKGREINRNGTARRVGPCCDRDPALCPPRACGYGAPSKSRTGILNCRCAATYIWSVGFAAHRN